MRKYVIFFLVILFFSACATTKTVYVPTESVHKIEYRDSVIRIVDTVKIEIPKEKIIEVVPQLDTSVLETKLAISTAYLDTDNKVIHHTLENKPNSLKTAIDTVVVIKTKTEYLEKPVIVEVEKEVKYIPKIYRYAMWFSLTVLLMIGLKLFSKFKGGLF